MAAPERSGAVFLGAGDAGGTTRLSAVLTFCSIWVSGLLGRLRRGRAIRAKPAPGRRGSAGSVRLARRRSRDRRARRAPGEASAGRGERRVGERRLAAHAAHDTGCATQAPGRFGRFTLNLIEVIAGKPLSRLMFSKAGRSRVNPPGRRSRTASRDHRCWLGRSIKFRMRETRFDQTANAAESRVRRAEPRQAASARAAGRDMRHGRDARRDPREMASIAVARGSSPGGYPPACCTDRPWHRRRSRAPRPRCASVRRRCGFRSG